MVFVVGTKTIVEVPGWLHEDLHHDIEHYRDRTLSRFDRNAVQRVEIAMAGRKLIALKRKGAGWIITQPKKHVAKAWKVDDMVRVFSLFKADSLFNKTPTKSQLREWMLAPPLQAFGFLRRQQQGLG